MFLPEGPQHAFYAKPLERILFVRCMLVGRDTKGKTILHYLIEGRDDAPKITLKQVRVGIFQLVYADMARVTFFWSSVTVWV